MVAAATLLVAAAAGCGGGSGTVARRPHATVAASGPFALLGAAQPPGGWQLARTALGATLPYPPGWRPLPGDRGTLSAALRDSNGGYLGYLNLTPRQGGERQSTWAAFRVAHNREEGDRSVRVLATARGVRLRGGTAVCVKDTYTTSIATRYVELACLIAGTRPAVAVGAAPPGDWRAQGPIIARAISAVSL